MVRLICAGTNQLQQRATGMVLFHVWNARRLRSLTGFSRSKFKMVWQQFSTVQFPSHHFAGKSFSPARGTEAKCLPLVCSVKLMQFHPQTFPILTRIDLAGSVCPRLGSVPRVSSCLGGEEEAGAVLGTLQRRSQTAGRGLSPV